TRERRFRRRSWLLSFVIAASAISAPAQTSTTGGYQPAAGGAAAVTQPPTFQVSGSVPTGTSTNEVLPLTLRDAVGKAVRYNLGAIESGENSRIARGQKLIALSGLLPHVSANVAENVNQLSLVKIGLPQGIVSPIIGPFGYSEAGANLSWTLFS